MKKILLLTFLFVVIYFSAASARAQMMGYPTGSASSSAQNSSEDAAGKAIWDKLSAKQLNCKDLTDDDFDKLGDFFMGSMMGSSHDYMDNLMTQRLGQNGDRQMHIAMGRRLSGCDVNASFPQGYSYFMPMMGGFGGMMSGWNTNNQSWGNGWSSMMGNSGWGNMMNGAFGSWSILGLLTWILVTVFLVLGIIYFWRGINRPK
ncbi:MAG: hypothetical protein M1352_00635 [Patescibacteria group bacterium]|nr:hypothetical protein [Patescibacteria group bacterium]